VATTKHLPANPDAVAPDGSDVRILLSLSAGGMAHFTLAPGLTSVGIRHRSVEEIWYVLSGRGQMWQRGGDEETTLDLEPGDSLTIPVGTHFQFRSLGPGAFTAVGVTMPPWPGDHEAVRCQGPWIPSVEPGPGLAQSDPEES
jgi:mannose-6-phosphate isomerase-like protein (cupin superfamily)